jgi:hypothetical protein
MAKFARQLAGANATFGKAVQVRTEVTLEQSLAVGIG